MQRIRDLSLVQLTPEQKTIITIGSYDGIHRGHKRIIRQVKQIAQSRGLLSALVTFHPHPKAILFPGKRLSYLTTVDEKLYILEKLGLDLVAILPFSRQVAKTSADDFMQRLVDALRPVELWAGPDFRLGRGGSGDLTYLAKLGETLGYLVQQVDLETESQLKIASSDIRSRLEAGQVEHATALLGHWPFLQGMVVHGQQRGRSIGYPTANVAVEADKLLPANGVYAVWVEVDSRIYPAVANIGVRPTFDDAERTVEVHLLDFEADLYHRVIRVAWVARLRPEQKFNGVNELMAQIKRDVGIARGVLSGSTPHALVA